MSISSAWVRCPGCEALAEAQLGWGDCRACRTPLKIWNDGTYWRARAIPASVVLTNRRVLRMGLLG